MLQFIDGRLAKLNEGKGFTDVFEEEITEGGFCGSEWYFLRLGGKKVAPLGLEMSLHVMKRYEWLMNEIAACFIVLP